MCRLNKKQGDFGAIKDKERGKSLNCHKIHSFRDIKLNAQRFTWEGSGENEFQNRLLLDDVLSPWGLTLGAENLHD